MLESYANGDSAHLPRLNGHINPLHHDPVPLPVARPSAPERMQVQVAADALLSSCWQKACEFARNFSATQISIEFLLLGAAHVRDAEPALTAACPDVEALSHALATRCARRSFAAVPTDTGSYAPDKTLKALLCETGAFAASREMPAITLSLLLEAVALHQPTLPVLDVLPTLQRAHLEHIQQPTLHLLEQIADRLQAVESQITGPTIEALETPLPFPQRDGLADAVAKLQGDVGALKGHLLYYPSGTANPYEPQPQPHLVIPSREEMARAMEELPKRIAAAVIEEIGVRQPVMEPPAPIKRRWFRRG